MATSSIDTAQPTCDVPLFVVGMPRSGTTFLRSVLSVHPNIAMSRESHFIIDWWPKYQNVDLNDPDRFAAFWDEFAASYRFPRIVANPQDVKARILAADHIDLKTVFACVMDDLAQHLGKTRWGEKTPRHYRHLNILLDWFPQAQVIWMVRDPRAVVSSIRQRWPQRHVDHCARQWCESAHLFEQLWREDERVKLVRYENLVTNCESEVRDICEFLGEDFYPSMVLDRSANIQLVNMPEGVDPNPENMANRQASKSSLEKWRDKLPPAEVATVEHYAGVAMPTYDYERITSGLNRIQSAKLGLIRIGRRLRKRWDHTLEHLTPGAAHAKRVPNRNR